ncbi:MAG TPA: M67 family metallopeptidase [Actinomycetota bacterium]|nr:M67 family metallopeptidase [Actinomycetota bacterium]
MLEIPRPMFEAIVTHARSGLPNEACGVLAGRDGRAEQVYPMRNAEESPVVYRFDEQEQLRVFGEVEDRGWDLVAFFHSHPRTEAYPSPTDRALAHWRDAVTGEEVAAYPGVRYVIVSLADGEPTLRAFTFDRGEPVEEEVRIS